MILLLQQAESTVGTGYVGALLQSLLALGAVCILAWVILRWSAQRGLGQSRGRMRIIEKLPLESRRTLYLVEVADRVLLIGAGDGGAPSLIAEFDPNTVPDAPNVTGGIDSWLALWKTRAEDGENQSPEGESHAP